MGTAYSTLKTRVLTQLRDTGQQKWSDNTELFQLISNAEQWLAQFLGNIPRSGRFTVQETIALSASTEAFSISSLTSAATKTFVAVRYMDILTNSSTRQPVPVIPEGDENLWRSPSLVGGDVVPGYFIRNDQFIFLPLSSAARTIYCTYQWVPIVKTSSSDTAETPVQYDDMLVNRAVFDAQAREGESEGKFEEKYSIRLAEIEDMEASRLDRGGTQTVKNVTSRLLFG